MKPTITVKVLLTERFESPKEWVLEVPREMRPEHIADLVFELSNCPPDFLSESKREILAKYPRTGLRSVSVGDIIIIGETEMPHRHIATVESMGFNFH
jgi:hypothetical protein